ncbi:hypothetical protein ACMX2M_01345 [Paenibacillus polymyxa]|uniref:hypothetical protein n=1 Tax=Paenibacillus TaxID=44249 RepID=UPI001059E9B2|nr:MULTISPECIES: hypothetical protein [Paenibacillus]MCL6660925.1 hypothetical protein [Paenibacillus amylolyticus]TDL70560.1 hypothetical protein E2R58_15940 [Paenibacillus amylolyticus]UOK62465.1 hypothetical protein MT997_30105 [Paenibacillus sp. OVF10]WJM07015.1 hypothetical protein QNO02_22565 [Paenibacillus sp. PK1-4R]
MKLPMILNVVRILLSIKVIYLIISFSVFLYIFSQNPEAFAGYQVNGNDLINFSNEITGRIIFLIIPSLLAIICITKRQFRSTVTFLSIALFIGLLNEGLLTGLIQLFALLVVLLHRPSKIFLKRQDSNDTETQYIAKKSLT